MLLRLKENTHKFECKYTSKQILLENEYDLGVALPKGFVVKSRKIIYLRWREIYKALGSPKIDVFLSEITKLKIQELFGGNFQKLENQNYYSICGWRDEGKALTCICCLRKVDKSILIKDGEVDANKFEFNPLAFHLGWCYFSGS
jgi:hypothetical protein